jgi:hypothetical protein
VRFPEFLRTAVLLFAGAATVLASVALVGADQNDDAVLVYVALGWWVLAAIAGLWVGRRAGPTQGIARMMAKAKNMQALPEEEPGTILFNRLWSLAVFALVAGALAFLVPQVPAIGAGYLLILALAWRKQSAAVAAIEGRDGVRFYVEHTSPFRPTQLLRTPGFRTSPEPQEVPPTPESSSAS